MIKRTTIEIDQGLLSRAKAVLGEPTTRATVEEALRRMAGSLETEQERRAEKQGRFLRGFGSRVDLEILATEQMWR